MFSGMGTQWPAMGRNMMTIEVFRDSIKTSDAILAPYGINLYETIMAKKDVCESIMLSFVGIVAIQVRAVPFENPEGQDATPKSQ